MYHQRCCTVNDSIGEVYTAKKRKPAVKPRSTLHAKPSDLHFTSYTPPSTRWQRMKSAHGAQRPKPKHSRQRHTLRDVAHINIPHPSPQFLLPPPNTATLYTLAATSMHNPVSRPVHIQDPPPPHRPPYAAGGLQCLSAVRGTASSSRCTLSAAAPRLQP